MITKFLKALFLEDVDINENIIILSENESIENESIENESIENESIKNNFESKNYIILILLLILLIVGLGGLYYYQLQETIPDILNNIKLCVDETTYLQVKNVIEEILNKPHKKLIGIELLKLMKLIVQPHRVYDVNNFHMCIDKLIKIICSED
jgi:hypothetical protein